MFRSPIIKSGFSNVPPPYASSLRYPEITERTYAIRNVGTGLYFDHRPPRVEPSSTKRLEAQITYADTSNAFRMQYGALFTRFSANAIEVVSEGSLWVLERGNDPAGALDRALVISGETTSGAGGNPTQLHRLNAAAL
ncbi:hypothetical protein H0H92_002573 [Tricholoma furcatifolium]|nr:hypothetical protein H0H92_002573 [Tricholoma furcatifolium]